MARSKTFTITKDFSNNTLENVFVLEQGSAEGMTEAPSLREEIESALGQAETVCLVAETAFSDELRDLLYKVRQEGGQRVYVLTQDLQQKVRALEGLKDNCIVREVPHISGNYLLCDRTMAFFFDEKMNGYAVKNEESVQKLHDLFIYNFWKEAIKEFIREVTDVAEQTFDVAPVNGDENVIIDRSALAAPPYRKCLENADSFVTLGKFPHQLKNTKSSCTLYLDKEAWESNKDNLLKEQERTIILADGLGIPLCKSKDVWYILNNNFDNGDNTGRFFSVKMEGEPVFINTRKFYPTLTYGQAVGKSLSFAKDFKDVEILESDIEERSASYDLKKFKEIARMKEVDREAFFDKLHLLFSDKEAAKVTFNVTMTVKKLSKDAKEAPVYGEYKNFIAALKNEGKKIKENKISAEESQEVLEKELQNVTQQLQEFQEKKKVDERNHEKQGELEEKIKELKDLIQKTKQESGAKGLLKKAKEESSGDSKEKELERQLTELQKQQKSLGEEIKKFQKEKKAGEQLLGRQSEIQKELADIKEKVTKLSDLMSTFGSLPKEPETVEECKKIKSELPDSDLKVPSFDKPRYGILYKIKNDYEYELRSDDDSELAEKEMEEAGIEKVEFVSAS